MAHDLTGSEHVKGTQGPDAPVEAYKRKKKHGLRKKTRNSMELHPCMSRPLPEYDKAQQEDT
jgi:hypothetical protein